MGSVTTLSAAASPIHLGCAVCLLLHPASRGSEATFWHNGNGRVATHICLKKRKKQECRGTLYFARRKLAVLASVYSFRIDSIHRSFDKNAVTLLFRAVLQCLQKRSLCYLYSVFCVHAHVQRKVRSEKNFLRPLVRRLLKGSSSLCLALTVAEILAAYFNILWKIE